MVTDHRTLDVLLLASLVGIETGDNQIHAITTIGATGGRGIYEAAAFVDATGDAVLAAELGPTAIAPAPGPLQTATMAVRFAGLDAQTLDHDQLRVEAQRARAAGLTLSGDSGSAVSLPSGDTMTLWVDRDLDPLDPAAISHATRSARAEAWTWLELLHRVAGGEQARIVMAGPQLGMRQSDALPCERRSEMPHSSTARSQTMRSRSAPGRAKTTGALETARAGRLWEAKGSSV